MAALIVSNGVISSLEPTVPLYLQQQFGYGAVDRGLLWLPAPLAYALGTPVAGMAADHWESCHWKLLLMRQGSPEPLLRPCK